MGNTVSDNFVSFETTDVRGTVEQKRLSVNETVLDLSYLDLFRIVGLERATTLRTLVVRRPKTHFWCRISHVLVVSLSQLNNNNFVDVPACVLALSLLDILDVSLVLSLFFSSLSLLTPL
jgi:hypothetical protein